MPSDRMNMLDEEIEAELANDDGSTTRAALEADRILHFKRNGTPHGHAIRVHADAREEMARVDLNALTAILG